MLESRDIFIRFLKTFEKNKRNLRKNISSTQDTFYNNFWEIDKVPISFIKIAFRNLKEFLKKCKIFWLNKQNLPCIRKRTKCIIFSIAENLVVG